MPINKESLNRRLYKVLSRYNPKALDYNGEVTPVEDEADVFKLNFTKDGEDYGIVYVTIDDTNTLTIWYGDDVMDSPSSPTPGLDYDDSFTGFTTFLKNWAMNNQLGFNRQDRERLGNEMARRKHMKEKEKIAEGYYPMGKKASYSDNVPNVKIVLQHSKVMQEGEQRFRHIEKIFVENASGERFLVPTTKPGLARVFARHIAEGGTPYDERAGHIQSLVEEYNKMAGFVRATRNGQFNESAQQLVNEGINHYLSLRESLGKLTGHRGYTAYFESWTPPLMEDEADTNNINELFVQETLDPRIESVMPILSKLHKKVAEMKEVDALSEWADSLLEGNEDDLTEEESLTSNNPVGIPEEEEIEEGVIDTIKKVGSKVLDKLGHGSDEELLKKLQKDAGIPAKHGKPAMAKSNEEDVEEGFVGNMIDKAKGMFNKPATAPAAPATAAPIVPDAATKAKIAAAPQGYDPNTGKPLPVTKTTMKLPPGVVKKGGTMDMTKKVVAPVAKPAAAPAPAATPAAPSGSGKVQGIKSNVDVNKLQKFDGIVDVSPKIQPAPQIKDAKGNTWTKTTAGWTDGKRSIDRQDSTYQAFDDAWRVANGAQPGNVGVAEDLDANQKRVGQLGPTEKVKNNNIGKLVGANESKINEMDSEGYKGTRDDYEIGKGKEGKAKLVKPGDVVKKGVKALDKAMDDAHKDKKKTDENFIGMAPQAVAEAQDELAAIKRLLGK